MLGHDPNVCKLTTYKNVLSFNSAEEFKAEAVTKVVCLDSEVLPSDQPHTNPVQKICFAAIGPTGKSAMYSAEFQVDMDFNICEVK